MKRIKPNNQGKQFYVISLILQGIPSLGEKQNKHLCYDMEETEAMWILSSFR